MRNTSGNSAVYREYGVHNGATCVVQAWELDPLDQEMLRDSQDSQVVLQALPRRLIVRMDRRLNEQYAGLPENCFPLSPVTVYWTLDADDTIEIHRRGFPVVPNFSTTIDGATGKTVDTALVDLGNVSVVPSFARAMRGYIALSRVKKVDDLLLAQPFSPALFRQGKQPWAALLLDTLRGEVAWPGDEGAQAEGRGKQRSMLEEVAGAERRCKKPQLLKDMCWACATCTASDTLSYKKFLLWAEAWTPETYDEYWKQIIAPGTNRRCLGCMGRSASGGHAAVLLVWATAEECLLGQRYAPRRQPQAVDAMQNVSKPAVREPIMPNLPSVQGPRVQRTWNL